MRWFSGMTDSMGHESEQAPGVGDEQDCLACCSPWGRKESDTTERLNNNNKRLSRSSEASKVLLMLCFLS